MARQKQRASQDIKLTVSEKTEIPITQEEQKRQVTPADGIPKILEPPRLIQWMVGRGSAPTVFHCPQKPGIRGATLITPMPEEVNKKGIKGKQRGKTQWVAKKTVQENVSQPCETRTLNELSQKIQIEVETHVTPSQTQVKESGSQVIIYHDNEEDKIEEDIMEEINQEVGLKFLEGKGFHQVTKGRVKSKKQSSKEGNAMGNFPKAGLPT
ncbi:hypothetical protein HAX54_018103 [Datura stramonium]|uniref:Uncharacterized protein n=1 Tax=Datura stramonium TaxID=4076 RepID=A0ABS8UNX5_DATST|nr:hypothetical protein [Datura stramonium]